MATALRLGATDLSGPIDTVWTGTRWCASPQGAAFTLSQFTPPASSRARRDRLRQSRSQTMLDGGASPSSSIGSCLSMWPMSPL